MKYTFHVVGLPHTQTTKDYNCCAYTGKVIRFCKMMKDLGHTVYLYGTTENEAICDEFITCYYMPGHPHNYLNFPFDPAAENWQIMNTNVIQGIRERKRDKDFICLIAGRCQKQIADAFPEHFSVEFGVGYSGTFSQMRVFESYAWMHTMYGAAAPDRDASKIDGSFLDTVIPNYYDPASFSVGENRSDYFMYLGRLEDRKGWRIAQSICKEMGLPFIVAGPGQFDGYGQYAGIVNDFEKANLLSHARGVFCPSLYIEPFCGVMAEALLSGTPVIATPWGSFAENILPGRTGFLCHKERHFKLAVENIGLCLPAEKIREIAVEKFSMQVVAIQYNAYFDRLYDLWEKGWYQ